MKKLIISFFLALIALFAFAGCTDTPTQTKPNDDGTSTETPTENDGEVAEMYLTVNGNKVKVTLEDNSSTRALVEILKKGDIVYTADDYGGFEKVGALGHTLPNSDVNLTTQAGDVILYSSNQIVLFYGSNSWSYTRLGKMEGYSISELRTLLCAGEGPVQVTLSLE